MHARPQALLVGARFAQGLGAALSSSDILAINVAAGIEFFTIPAFGLLSDHLGRRRTYILGCLFLAAFARAQ